VPKVKDADVAKPKAKGGLNFSSFFFHKEAQG